MNIPAPVPANGPRLASLDALRGFDLFWLVGGEELVRAFGAMSTSAPAQYLVREVDHKEWAGFNFFDLIFPLFVFIAGTSLVFSLTRLIEQRGRGPAIKRLISRGAALFLLGIFYNGGLAHAWPDVRLLGVLQRIAIVYTAAGLLFCLCRPRTLAAVGLALLAGYWVLLTFVPIRDFQLEQAALVARLRVPAPTLEQVREAYDATPARITGSYAPGLNVANHFDFEHLPGAKYDTYWDPEGILSTLPAIATCLLGIFAGLLLCRPEFSATKKLVWLVGGGVALLGLGFLWGLQFPVVKKIWTSSFVLVAGGWSLLLLAAFYGLVDVLQWRRWCQPLVWIGMNPIMLYVLASIVTYTAVAERIVGGSFALFLDRFVAQGCGNLVVTLIALVLIFLLAQFFHRRGIFLRV